MATSILAINFLDKTFYIFTLLHMFKSFQIWQNCTRNFNLSPFCLLVPQHIWGCPRPNWQHLLLFCIGRNACLWRDSLHHPQLTPRPSTILNPPHHLHRSAQTRSFKQRQRQHNPNNLGISSNCPTTIIKSLNHFCTSTSSSVNQISSIALDWSWSAVERWMHDAWEIIRDCSSENVKMFVQDNDCLLHLTLSTKIRFIV